MLGDSKRFKFAKVSHAEESTTSNQYYAEVSKQNLYLKNQNQILQSEIKHLQQKFQRIVYQSNQEIQELNKENKYLQNHIRNVQEKLAAYESQSTEQKVVNQKVEELKSHIVNLENEIKRRQEREIKLIEQNEAYYAKIIQSQGYCKRLYEDLRRAEELNNQTNKKIDKGLKPAQTETIETLKVQIEILKEEKANLEKDLDCILELNSFKQ